MPPEFGGKWEAKCLNTTYHMRDTAWSWKKSHKSNETKVKWIEQLYKENYTIKLHHKVYISIKRVRTLSNKILIQISPVELGEKSFKAVWNMSIHCTHCIYTKEDLYWPIRYFITFAGYTKSYISLIFFL